MGREHLMAATTGRRLANGKGCGKVIDDDLCMKCGITPDEIQDGVFYLCDSCQLATLTADRDRAVKNEALAQETATNYSHRAGKYRLRADDLEAERDELKRQLAEQTSARLESDEKWAAEAERAIGAESDCDEWKRREAKAWRTAVEIVEAYMHRVPEEGGDELDRLGRYSNSTLRIIIARLRAAGGRDDG